MNFSKIKMDYPGNKDLLSLSKKGQIFSISTTTKVKLPLKLDPATIETKFYACKEMGILR